MSGSPFKILDVSAQRWQDSRGHLDVLYEQGNVVLKRSFSRAGVFRGMHWQRPPHEQTKLIRVVSGRILDFVADPSKQPVKLHRREIGPLDGWIQIDSHFAHGFYAIEDSEFEYLCIGPYNENEEFNFSIKEFLNSQLNLNDLELSAKDSNAKQLVVVDGGIHTK